VAKARNNPERVLPPLIGANEFLYMIFMVKYVRVVSLQT
jgi:hypothetical protein